MLQCILRPNLPHLLSGPSAERTSRGGQQQLSNFVRSLTVERLKDRAVLTVHRKDLNSLLFCQGHNEMPRRYQCFLIGQRNVFAGIDGLNSRAYADHTHYSSQYNIHIIRSGCLDQPIHSRENPDIHIGHADRQLFGLFLIPHHCDGRLELTDLRLKYIHIGPRRKGSDLNISIVSHHFKGLSSDGSRRP